MKRMVVIATLRRGAVTPHEPVSAELEVAMFERQYFESGATEASVHWRPRHAAKLPKRVFEPRAKVERLMELARKRG